MVKLALENEFQKGGARADVVRPRSETVASPAPGLSVRRWASRDQSTITSLQSADRGGWLVERIKEISGRVSLSSGRMLTGHAVVDLANKSFRRCVAYGVLYAVIG